MVLMGFLMLSFLWATPGTSLDIQNMYFQLDEGMPSCSILKHREQERKIHLQELQHILDQDWGDDIHPSLALNHIFQKKLFFDNNIWTNKLSRTILRVSIDKKMAESILKNGEDNAILAIDGLGFHWASETVNFPEDVSFYWVLHSEEPEVFISYKVFPDVSCADPSISTPKIRILEPDQLDEYFKSRRSEALSTPQKN